MYHVAWALGIVITRVFNLVLLGDFPNFVLEILVLCWIDQKQVKDRKVHKLAALKMF